MLREDPLSKFLFPPPSLLLHLVCKPEVQILSSRPAENKAPFTAITPQQLGPAIYQLRNSRMAITFPDHCFVSPVHPASGRHQVLSRAAENQKVAWMK